MSKVAVMIGSRSDLAVMQNCLDVLSDFNVSYEVKILSAHRTPKQTEKFVKQAGQKGFKVIIAAAGMAAHLAGVVAAYTILPVIGVPMESKALVGIDALFSIVQMPGGVPVGCMAIGKAGAKNSALFAIQIIATSDKKLQKKLADYKKQMEQKVLKG